jgi:alkaline phosphatase
MPAHGKLPITLIVLATFLPLSPAAAPYPSRVKPVKNLIILIPDGCGTAHMSIARWFTPDHTLVQDHLHAGLVTTHSANSLITGSAAAATAFATGYKTWEDKSRARCLAQAPDTLRYGQGAAAETVAAWQPVATILEAAKQSGRSVGIVANCNSNHATPAAFSAHWHDRGDGNCITEQQVYFGLDVMLAGGYANLLPASITSGKRGDGDNLLSVLEQRGYAVVTSAEQLDALPATTGRVWGTFAPNHLCYEIDRTITAPTQPSLAARTKKAIELLERNRKKGFVLVVEGSEVDWASHDNDPVGVISEYLAFNDAVGEAVAFAQQNGKTEVLVFPDHDNGGMSLGRRGDDYTSTSLEPLRTIINGCTMSCARLFDSLVTIACREGSLSWKSVADYLESEMKITDITGEDNIFGIAEAVNRIACTGNSKTHEDVARIGEVISRRCNIGWTTFGHTGNMVPLYSFRLFPEETFDNTDIARYCELLLRVDLNRTTQEQFVPAGKLFPSSEYHLSVDTNGVAEGAGSLTVEKGAVKVQIPFNRDYALRGNDTLELGGRALYSKMGNMVYLPEKAGKLFSGKN